jgi:hypothetical protein
LDLRNVTAASLLLRCEFVKQVEKRRNKKLIKFETERPIPPILLGESGKVVEELVLLDRSQRKYAIVANTREMYFTG